MESDTSDDAELAAALALSMGGLAAAGPTEEEELRAALALSVGEEAPARSAAGGGGGGGGALDPAALARAMAQLAASGLLGSGGGRKRPRGGGGGGGTTPLPCVLDADALSALVRNGGPSVAAALLPLLPASQRSEAQLLDTLRSPQLRQAAMALTAALDDAHNAPSVFAAFGLQPSDGAASAARGDAVGALIDAVQAAVDREVAAAAAAPAAAAADAGGGAAPVSGDPR